MQCKKGSRLPRLLNYDGDRWIATAIKKADNDSFYVQRYDPVKKVNLLKDKNAILILRLLKIFSKVPEFEDVLKNVSQGDIDEILQAIPDFPMESLVFLHASYGFVWELNDYLSAAPEESYEEAFVKLLFESPWRLREILRVLGRMDQRCMQSIVKFFFEYNVETLQVVQKVDDVNQVEFARSPRFILVTNPPKQLKDIPSVADLTEDEHYDYVNILEGLNLSRVAGEGVSDTLHKLLNHHKLFERIDKPVNVAPLK